MDCSYAARKARYVEALEKLILSADSGMRREFLSEFLFHILWGFRPVEGDLDDLHFALFEEWHLIRTRTSVWMPPEKKSKKEKVMCCHYKKSTEDRPLLEAECRRRGVVYTSKTTRFALAALLMPELPGHCSTHMSQNKKRRSDTNRVFLRGRLTTFENGLLRLRGTWSAQDKDWPSKSTQNEGFNYWSTVSNTVDADSSKRFMGYFKIGTEKGVADKNLKITILPKNTSDDPFQTLEGSGDNDFGAFTMNGSLSDTGALFIVRQYVTVYDDENTPLKRRRGRPAAESNDTSPLVITNNDANNKNTAALTNLN